VSSPTDRNTPLYAGDHNLDRDANAKSNNCSSDKLGPGLHRSPVSLTIIYILTIPIFGLFYSLHANHFYQSSAGVEGDAIGLSRQTEAALLEAVTKWFEYLRENAGLAYFPPRDISVTGLSTTEESLTFHTPFTRSIPRTWNISSYSPRWELEFPPIRDTVNHSDPGSVRLFVRITGVPHSVSYGLSPYALSNSRVDKYWGPVRGRVVSPADTGKEDGVIEGYLELSRESYEVIERYRQAHLGSPSVLDNTFVRFTYFSATTITTLGYGDIVPLTARARAMVGFETMLGLVVIGLFLNSLTYKLEPGIQTNSS
jgi:hypothetical protein